LPVAPYTAGRVGVRAKEFGDEGGRHVHFAFSAGRARLACILERPGAIGASPTSPVEHAGGDLSIYVEDPEGTVVEIWDYFEDGDAWSRVPRGRARAGALASPSRHADLPAASALALSGEQ